jgi:SAM-dependent methyltransferase
LGEIVFHDYADLATDMARLHQYYLARELACGRDVLEVGFRDGLGAALVAQLARSVIAIDSSKASVARAHHLFGGPGINFVQGSLTDRDAASADLVLALYPANWRHDLTSFHAAACRILRPGGVLLLGATTGAAEAVMELLRRSHSHVAFVALQPILGTLMIPDTCADVDLGIPLNFEKRAAGAIVSGVGLYRPIQHLCLASDERISLPVSSAFIETSDLAGREKLAQLQLATREVEAGILVRKARQGRDAAIQRNISDRAEALLARQEIERQLGHVSRLLDDAQIRLAQMEASTSWRLTGPLRALIARVRAAESPQPPVEALQIIESGDAEPVARRQIDARAPESPLFPGSSHLVNQKLQRSALGLDLPLPRWRVSILLAAANATPRQLDRCIASAMVALERGGFASEIVLIGAAAKAPARSIEPNIDVNLARAHNLLMKDAFAKGADICLIADPKGAFHPHAIKALMGVVAAHKGRALAEASRFPEENPKAFDPVTLRTDWVANQCLSVTHEVFETIGGFDENFGNEGQDVDLSWRARARGVPVLTAPNALFLLRSERKHHDIDSWRAKLSGGVLLARKWGAVKFENAASNELTRLGWDVPSYLPDPVPASWRVISDFDHQFSYSQTRWSS